MLIASHTSSFGTFQAFSDARSQFAMNWSFRPVQRLSEIIGD